MFRLQVTIGKMLTRCLNYLWLFFIVLCCVKGAFIDRNKVEVLSALKDALENPSFQDQFNRNSIEQNYLNSYDHEKQIKYPLNSNKNPINSNRKIYRIPQDKDKAEKAEYILNQILNQHQRPTEGNEANDEFLRLGDSNYNRQWIKDFFSGKEDVDLAEKRQHWSTGLAPGGK